MRNNPLSGLVIRSAVVRQPDLGFILAGDPKKEAQEIPHTIAFRWNSGTFNRGEAKFSAHSCCIIENPEYGVVKIAGPGFYSVETRSGVTAGNIFDDSQPDPKEPRYGDIRSVSEIGGKAYAVGSEGMVYRLDQLTKWIRIDEELSRSFDIEAIHGFDAFDMYAVGFLGELWHFNGQNWTKRELPTNVNLTAVKCAGDGAVYIAGHDGILIRGREHTWAIIDHEEMTDDVWDLEWFEGELYVSTMSCVYRLKEEELELVDFGDDPPKTCYHLSAAKGVIWSIGEYDIMSFDGQTWRRIV